MNKIKVYLQYPWKFPDSPYYKYLVENPPQRIKYLNAGNQKGVIVNKKRFLASNLLKTNIRRFLNRFKLPIPNAHFVKKGNYDLIHGAHCLILGNSSPWVADFEAVWQLWASWEPTKLSNYFVRKILLSKNCKKIIAWTKETENRILKFFPEIKDKIEVVYPAVPIPNYRKKKHKGITLLFIGRYFYRKGGLHALEAFNILTKKYKNVRGIFISSVPEKILEKYSKNKKIQFFGLMQQKKLLGEIYPKSDIFVYPGYSDTFGFAMTEAMSFGIPIITVGNSTRKEIVEEGKFGFVIPQKFTYPEKVEEIDKKIIGQIVNKTSELIRDGKLRANMSKACINVVRNGKFSIKERNKKLERIYFEALK